MTPLLPPAARSRRRLRATLVGVGASLLLVVLAGIFDNAWLKPALRHYVMSHSGRRFDVGTVHVRFHGSLDPTVEFTDLDVQNAAWADPRPLIRARRAAATFSWRSLLPGELIVVRMMVLEGAQVDLERQADGLRNWRLGHPEDRGPPRVRVVALDARDSSLRTVHQGLGVTAEASIAPLASPRPVAGHPELPLTKTLAFHGNYRGRAFDGESAVSDVLSFGATPRRFSFDGHARLSGLRLDAHGLASDIHSMGDVDLDARLVSAGAGDWWPLPPGLARARPLVATAHVTKAGKTWTATALHAALGKHSGVDGELRVVDDRDDGHRRTVHAALRNAVFDLDDLHAIAGTVRPPVAASAPASGRLLPDTPLPLGRLRALDADVELADARILHSEREIAQSLRFRATLVDGRLEVSALDFGTAGGHLTGKLRIDGSQPLAELSLALQLRGVRLDQLSEKLAAGNGLTGRLDANASLHAQGSSARAMAAAASGTIEASLAAGASVSKRLDAKLGLNGGEWLASLFDKSERVPVRCAAVVLDVAHGVGTSRRFVFETARTSLAGRGTVNLADETLSASVTPFRTERALFALDRSLNASGPWRDIKVALAPPVADAAPQRCPPGVAATPASAMP